MWEDGFGEVVVVELGIEGSGWEVERLEVRSWEPGFGVSLGGGYIGKERCEDCHMKGSR